MADLKEMLEHVLCVSISTYGWKRRYAGQGIPWINIMVLLPTGGVIYFKSCSGGGGVVEEMV